MGLKKRMLWQYVSIKCKGIEHMLTNFLLGFALPWIFGFWLYRKNKVIVATISPFTAVIATKVNVILIQLDFYHIIPIFKDTESLSAIPFEVGLYPVLASWMTYLIWKKGHPFLQIVIFSLLTTFIELLGVLYGKVLYYNGWNLFWTFWSYFIPYISVYLYYRLLLKIKVISPS